MIWAGSLQDDAALLIAAFLEEDHLAPRVLALPVAEFKRLADLSTNDGRPVYAMGFPPYPKRRRRSRWSSHLLAPEQLPGRFTTTTTTTTLAPAAELFDPGRQGLLGELDLLSRLALRERLDLYRPFPDLEDIDVAVRHLQTYRVAGLQVKTLGYDAAHPAGVIGIHAASFRPLAGLHFVVYGWNRDRDELAPQALLIPAPDIPNLTRNAGGKLSFDWRPEHPGRTRLLRYAVPIDELAGAIEALVSGA